MKSGFLLKFVSYLTEFFLVISMLKSVLEEGQLFQPTYRKFFMTAIIAKITSVTKEQLKGKRCSKTSTFFMKNKILIFLESSCLSLSVDI